MQPTNKITFALFFIFILSSFLQAQSSNYPYFMKGFWSKEIPESTKTSLTNKLIENTAKGRDYVSRLNSNFMEFDQLMKNKNSLNRKQESYNNQAKSYEKQYNTSKIALALAQTNYNMCRSNCGGVTQNYNNIANNMNNLSHKINTAYNNAERKYNEAERISERLYELDRQSRSIIPELNQYIKENINNGTLK